MDNIIPMMKGVPRNRLLITSFPYCLAPKIANQSLEPDQDVILGAYIAPARIMPIVINIPDSIRIPPIAVFFITKHLTGL